MITTATQTNDAMPQAPPQTASVSIAGGLRGTITTGFDTSATSHRPLPDQKTWCDLLPPIVNDPCSLPGYEVLKYSGGNEVFRATLTWHSHGASDSINVVCKKTVSPRGLKGIADSFRTSRARKNFDRGLLLMNAGIATPTPLAAIDRARPRANWFITEFLPGLVDLDRIALAELPQIPPNRRRATKDSIIAATTDLFARLERNGLVHRDLKASNILIDGWQGCDTGLHTVLVDLDGIKKTARGDTRRWRSMIRLAASLLHYPSISRGDLARFLRRYLAATGSNASAWSVHFRRLSQGAIRYAEKSRARKSHKLDGYT